MNHEPEFPYTSNIVNLESDGQLSIYTLNNFEVVATLEGLEVYDAILNAISVLDEMTDYSVGVTGQNAKIIFASRYLRNVLNERE